MDDQTTPDNTEIEAGLPAVWFVALVAVVWVFALAAIAYQMFRVV